MIAAPPTRWVRFALVGCLGVGVQLAVIELLTTAWRVDYRLAATAGVAAAVAHNFLWHRAWTWRDRDRGRVAATFAAFAGSNGLVSIGGNLLIMQALVGGLHAPVIAANAVAIAACAVANYTLADRAVFRRVRPAAAARRAGAQAAGPGATAAGAGRSGGCRRGAIPASDGAPACDPL